jgi:hypothetical protein
MIMCDYCALSPAQRKTLRETFRLLLNPGGSVLLDVHSLHDFRRKEERAVLEESRADGFWSADKYYCFRNAFLYGEEKVSLDKYTIVEKDRVRNIYNWLQYFTPESIAGEFEQDGWKIGSYLANVAGDAFDPGGGEFAVIAGRGA